MTNTRQHTVMDAHGNPVATLHRGDHESTRHWYRRCAAADADALNPTPAPVIVTGQEMPNPGAWS